MEVKYSFITCWIKRKWFLQGDSSVSPSLPSPISSNPFNASSVTLAQGDGQLHNNFAMAMCHFSLFQPFCSLHLQLQMSENPYVSGSITTKNSVPGVIIAIGKKKWPTIHFMFYQWNFTKYRSKCIISSSISGVCVLSQPQQWTCSSICMGLCAINYLSKSH